MNVRMLPARQVLCSASLQELIPYGVPLAYMCTYGRSRPLIPTLPRDKPNFISSDMRDMYTRLRNSRPLQIWSIILTTKGMCSF